MTTETQLQLDFGPLRVPVVAPTRPGPGGTRQAAARSIFHRAGRLRAAVYRFIREQEERGATDLEIQSALGMDGSTQRPRRRELQTAGVIVDSGKTRTTPSGRAAVVWVAGGAGSFPGGR